MHSVPMPSHTASPVTSEVVTAARASTRPTSAPRSSRSTTGSSGCFERRMNCHQPTSGLLTWRASTMAVRNEKVSATMLNSRMPIAISGDSSSWGWRIFSMPS